MSENYEIFVTPLKNHYAIQHLKVKSSKQEETSKKHEEVLHKFDKTIDRILINSEHQSKRLDAMEKRQEAIERHQQRQRAKEERAEGGKDLLRKIMSFKSIIGFLIGVIVTLCSHISKHIGW